MQGEIEAAGDLATGGIIAHAVDARDTAHGAGHSSTCPNCGTALIGDFCHGCGQAAHLHKTLRSIAHDVLHGVFHFEGRLWRTVPMLFWKPGSLTRRYIAGERVRFVSPLALFLFSVFLMVATFETVGGPFGALDDESSAVHLNTGQMRQAIARNRVELARLRAERDALKTERDAATTSAPRRQQIRARIAAIAPRVAELDGENGKLGRVLGFASGGDSIERAAHDPKLHIDTGLPALDARIRHVLQSPELFLYRVQSSAYKFSWLLIPISLPFIWLVFAWRRDVGPYDHAIFAIYSLSAMTIGVAGLSMLRALGVPQSIIGLLFVFGPPFHIYKQLRGAYRVGRFGALWRTVALLVSATIAGVLFTLAILGVAA